MGAGAAGSESWEAGHWDPLLGCVPESFNLTCGPPARFPGTDSGEGRCADGAGEGWPGDTGTETRGVLGGLYARGLLIENKAKLQGDEDCELTWGAVASLGPREIYQASKMGNKTRNGVVPCKGLS